MRNFELIELYSGMNNFCENKIENVKKIRLRTGVKVVMK